MFDADVRRAHRKLRQRLRSFMAEASLGNVLTAPLVYSLIVPFALLDAWVTIYQRLAFPVYGIAPVRRRPYFAFDREHLAYLNGIERFNCWYCAYGNGVAAYVREVAARTEQYWCPIKHARRLRNPHGHYDNFVDFGDVASYKRRLPMLRQALNPRK